MLCSSRRRMSARSLGEPLYRRGEFRGPEESVRRSRCA